jgi:hypothetical protein
LILYPKGKSLLVRADFSLARDAAADAKVYKRWRRILIDALPRMLGCERRCPKAEHVRLRWGDDAALYSGWLRIAIERRPSRTRLRKFKVKLRWRLESALPPIGGRVVKVGVRRLRARAVEPARPGLPAPESPCAA